MVGEFREAESEEAPFILLHFRSCQATRACQQRDEHDGGHDLRTQSLWLLDQYVSA